MPGSGSSAGNVYQGKRIFFTGGGTAGHVTPNLALIEVLLKEGWRVSYVGTNNSIEQDLTADLNLRFFSIRSGKLRRYFDWQNFLDPFLVLWGILQAVYLCLRYRPHIVFSKGGFVAVPLVFAAWLCRVPVICHESDITPGLANRLSFPFCRYICVNFPETEPYLPSGKTRVTGSPVRRALTEGDAQRGRTFLSFDDHKPILLVVGGSLGAAVLNKTVHDALNDILNQFQLVHIVGKGNLVEGLEGDGYVQLEYLRDAFGDVLAATDFALSRAGANAIYELLLLKIPHLLVPLTAKASRGDQIINAKTFKAAGLSLVLEEEKLSGESLIDGLNQLLADQSRLRQEMAAYLMPPAIPHITNLIRENCR